MTFTPEKAKCLVEELPKSKLFKNNYKVLQNKHDETTYRFAFSIDPNPHIAISRKSNREGIKVYVNQLSIPKVNFFKSVAKHIKVFKSYPVGYRYVDGENSFTSAYTTFSSLNPDKNDVLCLMISTEEDFHLLLLWYLGFPLDQGRLRKFVIDEDYNKLPDDPFEPSSNDPIAEEQLAFVQLDT